MKERNTSNWDTMDFQNWVVRNIHLLLSGKQLDLFIKNNFGYDNLKFFGKIKEAENLKSVYQVRMLDKTITYNGDLQWTSINF